jgi:hypothetical protein
MQAGLYLTARRGNAAPEAQICFERAEPLCHSLGRQLLFCAALIAQWRYSVHTEKLTATMQIAERIHSLTKEKNDAALMIEAYRALACTLLFLADFESARQDACRSDLALRKSSVSQRYAIQQWSFRYFQRQSSPVCAI